ncbi:MAG: molybdenum ABC transporter ATP-binding protein [Pseudomonadales bacterium]|nr:molybdenum ABC transporter ATP-binding protein [Pseudomonadales bacterium]
MNTPNAIKVCFKTQYPNFCLDLNLELPGTGITAIFGPSGSGKTTLLRCIAGLQKPQHGELSIEGEIWQDKNSFLPTHKRPLGYVFQEASLFPHLSAKGNLQFAMKRAGKQLSRKDGGVSFDQAVSLLGIESLLEQYPDQLSGGERQRVAIARALLINPRLLLMDEPLAALDQPRKQEILSYLDQLRKELDIPVLYVSHSTDEIARLANHLVILEKGRVVTSGPLQDVLARVDLPVQLGEDAGVVLEAKVVDRDTRWHLARVAFSGGELWVRDHGVAIGSHVRVRVLARDVSLALQAHSDTSIQNVLAGTVAKIAPDTDPAASLVQVTIGESKLVARITQRSLEQLKISVGDALWVQIKSVALV